VTNPQAADDRIVASPMLDRNRVADTIQRGVRLEIHPAYARAALRGMPVELTMQQALEVADVALEALAKTQPGAKSWLIDANKGLRERGHADALRWKALLAQQRSATDNWRAASMGACVWMVAVTGKWSWRWPDWSFWALMAAGLSAGAVLRLWLLRRDQRKAVER
jgi:hypothetical protein